MLAAPESAHSPGNFWDFSCHSFGHLQSTLRNWARTSTAAATQSNMPGKQQQKLQEGGIWKRHRELALCAQYWTCCQQGSISIDSHLLEELSLVSVVCGLLLSSNTEVTYPEEDYQIQTKLKPWRFHVTKEWRKNVCVLRFLPSA